MVNRASRVSCPAAAPSCAPSRSSHARSSTRTLAATLALLGVVACVSAPAAGAETSPAACDKFASPQGSDVGTGSAAAPLRSAQELADSLAPGQVGCLHAGAYGGGLRFGHGGSAGAPLVLRSYPGERALITGRLWVPRGSNYVTVASLDLNGNHQSDSKPLPSPTVNGDHATFESDDVTNEHTEICFDVGSESYGVADATVIAENRIHDCGVMPAANHDHGIYVQAATNTQIVDNLITHNADRGIQLYPSSTGALIRGNVISENGEGIIFSGDGGVASNGNVVEHNLVVNSLIRSDIESWYPTGNPLGVGNVAQNNCVSVRGIDTSAGGFTARSNVTAAASELSSTAAGARPVAGSACAVAVPEVASRLGAEGAPSGGGPTPVGKAAGGGNTPAPVDGTPPAGAPRPGSHQAPTAGAPHAPAGKSAKRNAARRAAAMRKRHAGAAHRRRRAARRAHATRRAAGAGRAARAPHAAP